MTLFNTIFTILIAVYALYADKLPAEYRWQLSSTLGRLLLLLLLYIVFALGGWLPALLFTIGIAITWANRPLWEPVKEVEGFRGGGDFTTSATNTASQMSFGSLATEAMVGKQEKKDGFRGAFTTSATNTAAQMSYGASATEGFLDNMKETQATKNRWFVEKVLKENPKKIIEDRVRTSAIQE